MPVIFQHRLFKFAFVGGIGFVVDTAVFALFLYVIETPIFAARVIAFIVAATATWLGNRTLTFGDREKTDKAKQWQKHMVAAAFSAIPNLGVFKLVIAIFGEQGYMPFVALVAGILVGMFSNYFLSSKWVFADKQA
ncbi:putative GtrA-like protein [Vibrio nigripulchritudo SOn1]|uniref:GtrA-like protein n=1 Tax=Vibrio nigripulchritudo SOn1 TaxID=1238450 RepID=A0AAV2VLT3_9VIBR|nr:MULTISPECIES: GtrA family protein [Vibrio]KJY81078.1 polysaccharide biosynthesis protein GtrA [Vibrio nigripulchritudo]UAB69233.1 GtrA family protein [Vibrio sp. SCSIO 43132]CCO45638.1 putative GtrA-like protein [Vibrio nigripulchritudo SOn1]